MASIKNLAVTTGSSRRTFLGMLAGAPFAVVRNTASASSNSAAFHDLQKAMWVWKVDIDHLDALGAFVKEAGIHTTLLSLPAGMRADLMAGDVTALSHLRALREGGLSLGALTGDPSWVASPQRMPQSLDQILRAAAGNKTLFDRVSLDVEPNTLPAWHNSVGQKALMESTIAFYDAVRASANHIPIDAALNSAFAKLHLPDGQNFLEALARRLDSISIMAYRDNPEGTIKRAASAIALIEHVGIPWRLGVLVHASPESGTSFVGAGRGAFEADMIALNDMVHREGPSAHYRGLIFEDYHGLTKILRS